MRLAIVVHLTGTLVRLFSPTLLVPALVGVLYQEWNDSLAFVVTFVGSALLGTAMRRASGGEQDLETLRRVEGFAIVALAWLLMALVAALPYIWTGLGFVDSFFESMSGLTTTGATALTDFTLFGRAMFFWRSLTHWLGGMGVIALFVAILPRLAVAGRELFFAEAAGPTDEKITPQLRKTALALWQVYAGFTVAQVIALMIAGMSLFDAACHSMATLAAGGFSPHPLSLAGYNNAAVHWIIIVFMFVAGANFALQYRLLRTGRLSLLQDEEFKAYTGVVLVSVALIVVFLLRDGMTAMEALRHGSFQVLSIITTTGFASVDFQLWSPQAKMVLFLLMFIGGCAGSAGGGPKVVRHVLMARFTIRELKRVLHPRAILPVKLGGRVVPESILRDVQVFMLFYLLTFAVGTAIVVFFGADLITGITASIACLGNIGPGFDGVGPMASYGPLHPVSKIVLTLEMWIGRLEVLTVLVLFRFEVWRGARWKAA